MFDDPGKKLRQLEDALLEAENSEGEQPELDDPVCDEEEFDENDAVLAEEPRRPGLRTLVFLLAAAVIFGMIGWWLGWF